MDFDSFHPVILTEKLFIGWRRQSIHLLVVKEEVPRDLLSVELQKYPDFMRYLRCAHNAMKAGRTYELPEPLSLRHSEQTFCVTENGVLVFSNKPHSATINCPHLLTNSTVAIWQVILSSLCMNIECRKAMLIVLDKSITVRSKRCTDFMKWTAHSCEVQEYIAKNTTALGIFPRQVLANWFPAIQALVELNSMMIPNKLI